MEAANHGAIRHSEKDSGILNFTTRSFSEGEYEFTAIVTRLSDKETRVAVGWEERIWGANKRAKKEADKYLDDVGWKLMPKMGRQEK